MCSPSGNFKLCTCADEPAQLATAEFTWKLYRFDNNNPNPRMVMGVFILPVKQLADKLTETTVAAQLNTSSCFDFDYVPEENDMLQIYAGQDSDQFMRLRYNKGRWWQGLHPFRTDKVLLQKGVVKMDE